jgi:integrase
MKKPVAIKKKLGDIWDMKKPEIAQGRRSNRFSLRYRADRDTWIFSLHEECGLSIEICSEWSNKSIRSLPSFILARYPKIKTRTAAAHAIDALVEYLKANDEAEPRVLRGTNVWEWMRLFLNVETSPRATRLIGKGLPYSPATITHYQYVFNVHIKQNDPLMKLAIERVTSADLLEFFKRIAAQRLPIGRPKKRREGQPTQDMPTRPVANSYTYERIYSFVRMTFKEFQQTHKHFYDPFAEMERPKTKSLPREGLEEDEVLRLFTTPGVFLDEPELERAICAAMFWAGLRRSETFGLLSEDLDWKTPKITVQHAWKNFEQKYRELGDPKWHKIREAPFPDILQSAIRDLWKKNGKQTFALARADGSQPLGTWYRAHVYKWFSRAGIDLGGRRITPHSARHSLASLLEAQGVPLRYIQEILGHSNLKTTLGYLHAPQQTINDITAKLEVETVDINDLEHLEQRLQEALATEEYERAVRLRDQIRNIKDKLVKA